MKVDFGSGKSPAMRISGGKVPRGWQTPRFHQHPEMLPTKPSIKWNCNFRLITKLALPPNQIRKCFCSCCSSGSPEESTTTKRCNYCQPLMIYSILPLEMYQCLAGGYSLLCHLWPRLGKLPLQQICNFVQLRLAKCIPIFRQFKRIYEFCGRLVEQGRRRTIIYVISKMCLHVTLTEECSSDRCWQ